MAGNGDLTPEQYEMLFGEPPPPEPASPAPPPPSPPTPPPPPVQFSVATPPPPSPIQDAPPPRVTPSPLHAATPSGKSRFAGMSRRRKVAAFAVGGIAVISVINSVADDPSGNETVITDEGTEEISNFSETVEDTEAAVVVPIEDEVTTTTAAPTTTSQIEDSEAAIVVPVEEEATTTTTVAPTTTKTAAPTTTTTSTTTTVVATTTTVATTTAAPTTVAPAAVAPVRDCQGYNPCLEPGPDVDCAGGSGNGPRYIGRVIVTGSDPYDLDRDGNGVGCENS